MDGTPNIVRHSSTTADDLEQKIFISTRFTAKDIELRSRDNSGQASVQYSNNMLNSISSNNNNHHNNNNNNNNSNSAVPAAAAAVQ